MTVRAVLFDVDGTLVDSNYLHVEAWQRALAAVGREVVDDVHELLQRGDRWP